MNTHKVEVSAKSKKAKPRQAEQAVIHHFPPIPGTGIYDKPKRDEESEKIILAALLADVNPNRWREVWRQVLDAGITEAEFLYQYADAFKIIAGRMDSGGCRAGDLNEAFARENRLEEGARLTGELVTIQFHPNEIPFRIEALVKVRKDREREALLTGELKRIRGGQDPDPDLAEKLKLLNETNAHRATRDDGMLAILEKSATESETLSKLKIPPKKKFLGEWLCECDIGILYAPRGLGKTWMVNAIAKGIVTGSPVGEWSAGQAPARVLIVDGEMALADTQARIVALDMSSKNLYYLHHERIFDESGQSLNIADRDCQTALSRFVKEHRFDVVILDNLSTLALGMRENDADDWEQINPWLLELRRMKVATILVAHANRAGSIRGTSRREDNVNWILALKEDPLHDPDKMTGARFKTIFEKCRGVSIKPTPLTWEFSSSDTGQTTIQCTEYSGKDQMLQLISEGTDNNKDLSEALGLSKSTISKWASKLKEEGRIEKDARGNYRPIRP